jgi:UDP-N-acetylglucosamine acyltransferase
MAKIHPTAIVAPGAALADDVEVGAFSIVGAEVRVGSGSVIGPHCVIEGRTTIGSGNKISQFSAIGGVPQDKKYAGEPTELVIGDGNTIREFCTIHIGTVQDAGVTRIGDDNWIMNNVHVAHDCRVGSHTIIAGYSGLAGHVELGDWAIVGGMSGLLQFVRVGAHAMIGFQSHVSQDVPPFMMVDGHPLQVRGFNAEGMRRRGFSADRIGAVKQMHRLLYRDGLVFDDARAKIAELAAAVPEADPDVRLVVEFLAAAKRGIAR